MLKGKPIPIHRARCCADPLASQERRISHKRVEARIRPVEDLWKLDLPVKRRERRITFTQITEPHAIAVGPAAAHGFGKLCALRLALAWLLGIEERRNHQVAEEPHLAQLELRFIPHVAQLPIGHALIRSADALPQHPAVAYELLGDLAIFAALVFIYTRVNRSGVTFFAWVYLYGFMRFFLSFLRLDDEILLGLRAAQLVALAAVIVAPLAIIYLLKTPPAAERMGRAARRRAMREGSAVEEHPPG